MAYTRKELEKMSIKQLKMIEKELSRSPINNNNDRVETLEIQTISMIVQEGNNFVSFPYDLVDNTVEALQNQNPNIPFNNLLGNGEGGIGLQGGQGLFDTDGDGYMESGNLNTINKRSGYWLSIGGDEDNVNNSYELNFDIYTNVVDTPLRYNLFTPTLQCGGNKIISYDGIDGAHPLDTLGARGAFVERILGDGQGLFNTCLTDFFEQYDANGPYESQFDPNIPNYFYDESTCWSGNLTSMEIGKGYWINLYCTVSDGKETQYLPKNIQQLYGNMSKEPPRFSSAWHVNFGNFEWLRPQSSPPPKTTSALSNEEVRRKIKRVDTDGSLTGDDKNIRANIRMKPSVNRNNR